MMRLHEARDAYELKRVRNQQTQVWVGWEFKVFQVKPNEKLLFIGQSKERKHAKEHSR